MGNVLRRQKVGGSLTPLLGSPTGRESSGYPWPVAPAGDLLQAPPGHFAEDVAARSIALPFFPEMTESQVEQVAESLREVLGR